MSSIGSTLYRCGFDLKPNTPTAKWDDAVREVRRWISKRLSSSGQQDDALGKRWFFTGGDWKNKTTHVHIRACYEEAGAATPNYWALRFEHPCNEISHRHWITDIGITKIEENNYRFLLHLYHRLSSTYIGPEPCTPKRTRPGIVTALLHSKHFTLMAGYLELSNSPLNLPFGGGKSFYELITDADRLLPIVLVTRDHETGKTFIDPKIIADQLAGNAIVYVTTNAEVDTELDYFLGDNLKCRNGMVRIFQPKAQQDKEDSKRHRFFLPAHILSLGVESVSDQLTTALNIRARRWIGAGCETIEDVESEARRVRLRQLRDSAKNDQEQGEWLSLLEKDNSELSKEAGNAKRRIEELERELEEKAEQLEGATYQTKLARVEKNDAYERARIAESKLISFGDILELPRTIYDVVELIKRLQAGRLVFTKEANKSAKETSFDDVNSCWTCLWQMATNLHPLYFDDSLSAREIERKFKEQTGIELVMTEGKQTKADNRLMGLRKITYDDSSYDITPHVKLRTNNVDLRIHYAPDHQKQRLIIGHCGDHLETYGTRRRKEG